MGILDDRIREAAEQVAKAREARGALKRRRRQGTLAEVRRVAADTKQLLAKAIAARAARLVRIGVEPELALQITATLVREILREDREKRT
jgi:hypothetical protein